MTRLKTVYLLVFLCLGLSTNVLVGQSSSCVSTVNLSVDSNCEFTLSLETLRATGPAASAVSIVFKDVDSIFLFSGGMITTDLFELNMHYGGVIQYALYGNAEASGTMLCWGDVNLEIKNVPQPIIETTVIMCSQEIPDLPSIADVRASLGALCSAPLSDFTISEVTEGEACAGFRTIRTISATVIYGPNNKVVTPLRIDTIIETPLDTSMIVCPLGGPNKQDAIILFCDSIGNKYPTPDIVEEYAREGIRAAYPYIPKGLDTTITFRDTVVVANDTTTQSIQVTDASGNVYWATREVYIHRDTTITLADTTIRDIVLPLRPGPTCNLSTKFTDETFPGCAGPDSKVRRTWNVLDWCNGSLKSHVQWIIVETNGPVIDTIPDQFAGIAPWLCYAQFELSAEVDRGCSESLQVTFSSTAGVIEDNKLLTKLWLGDIAEVTVTAVDDCGQIRKETFTVTPIDSIAPIAIAEDQINVSLSGDPIVGEDENEDRGSAKVWVDAIDAGSHNSGCGEVTRCILLKEELEDPIFIEGVHAMIDGQLIYHPHGCLYDGVIPARPASKLLPARPEIPYVYCKEYVKFCCGSVGLNSVAMVVTNGGNRQGRTWTNVLVEDKSSPIIICPEPFTVACEEDIDIREPVVFNGYCGIEELEMTMTDDLDNCGSGIKTIIWSRGGRIVCTTEITIDTRSAFNPREIKWPKHYNNDIISGIRRECELLVDEDTIAILDDNGLEQHVIVEYLEDEIEMGEPFECTGDGFTGEPVWCNASCGLIGVNFEDQNVEAIEACKKVIRRWTIIDWCTWDPNGDNIDDENDGFDSFTAVDDEWLGEGDWLTDSKTTVGEVCEECDKPSGPVDYVYFRYDSVDVDGYYTFDQIIKIIDFDDPIVTAPDTIRLSISGGATAKGDDFDECVASDIVEASVADYCGDTEIDASGAGWSIQVFALEDGNQRLLKSKEVFGTSTDMGTQVGQSGDVHKISWVVRDGCGNVGSAETYILFVEDKNPTPICLQTISTSTMDNTGSATIWATDFDAGSFDNCSEVDLFFKDDVGNFVPSKTFTCRDIDNGVNETFDIELYAVDALGNFDFCNVSLRVDDFNDNCPNADGATGQSNIVSGSVATAFGDNVEDVAVFLSVGMEDMTSVIGEYAFKDLNYTSFEISATKNDDHLNGVTSIDAVLIQRHLLGQTPFETPYQIIAADANNDSRVSALDLVEVRKLILGVYDEFPRNTSWRFVSAAQRFDDPTLPFPFEEAISILDYQGSALGQNFMGVKIGDVNGNAIANSILAADNRSAGVLNIIVEDMSVKAGETVEVSVSSDNFSDIIAYQYTMELSGLEFVSATSGELALDEANFGMLDAQTVTTTWFSPEGVTSDGELYKMTFLATSDITIREGLRFTSSVTPAIAYRANQEQLEVGLEYNTIASHDFVLLQNVPNPFEQSTSIGFYLPQSGYTTLTVFDVTGKVLLTKNQQLGLGYNQITLTKTDLQSSGVLYYQLEYESEEGEKSYSATHKMIVID